MGGWGRAGEEGRWLRTAISEERRLTASPRPRSPKRDSSLGFGYLRCLSTEKEDDLEFDEKFAEDADSRTLQCFTLWARAEKTFELLEPWPPVKEALPTHSTSDKLRKLSQERGVRYAVIKRSGVEE